MIPKNENVTEEMVEILESLHNYVPVVNTNGEERYDPVLLGGDQLTSARAITAKKTRVTSRGLTGLRGLVPFASDWHAKVNYEGVSLQVKLTHT